MCIYQWKTGKTVNILFLGIQYKPILSGGEYPICCFDNGTLILLF